MRCRDTAIGQNGRCRRHGKNHAPPGPEHHRYKHGRYSKLKITTGLAERIAEREADPNLLSLSPDVALLETRIAELLETIEETAQPDAWKMVKQIAGKIKEAVLQSEADEAVGACEQLIEVAIGADVVNQNHREISRLIEQKRRVSESERKAKIEAGHLITAVQAVAILDRFVVSIAETLKDDPEKMKEVRRHYAATVGVYEPPQQEEVDDAS